MAKRLLLPALVIAGAILVPVVNSECQTAADSAVRYFDRGVAASDAGRHDEAIADYTTAIRLNPNFTNAYTNRGWAFSSLGRNEQAIADYTKSIQLKSNDGLVYRNRGKAYGNLRSYELAIADFTTAIQLNPNDADAYSNRGVAFEAIRNLDQAMADYTKSIQLNPNDAFVYKNRGAAYAKRGSNTAAIADITRAIQLNPNDAVAYGLRAVFFEATGNYDRAIVDYTRAIQLNPNYTQAYVNRAAAYRKVGKTALAEADELRTGRRSEVAAMPPPSRSSALSVAAYQPTWIGQTIVVQGTVSRFVQRNVEGEPYVYLYFKERPDSTIVACTRDAPWLLGVLGVNDFPSVVGKTLEFNGEVVDHPCTSRGASLWIYKRTQARIAGNPIH